MRKYIPLYKRTNRRNAWQNNGPTITTTTMYRQTQKKSRTLGGIKHINIRVERTKSLIELDAASRRRLMKLHLWRWATS